MSLPKWNTSMTAFAPLIFPVLEMLAPQHICEIGAAEGGNTKLLYDFLKARNGKLTTIDPSPRGTFLSWVQQSSDVVNHIAEMSLTAIPKSGSADAWFIDGDHNWYTVFNELLLVHQLQQQHHQPALIFLHDVGWPCARRDMYYDPTHVPPEFRQPYARAEDGISLTDPLVIKGFLHGPHWALQEGGPRNGVLTAIEDFVQHVAQSTRYLWVNIPAILGLGILIDEHHPKINELAQFYAPYHNHPLIALLEEDRILQHMGMVALNDKLTRIASTVTENV